MEMGSDFYSQISSNRRKTYFLLFLFFILIGILGLVLGYIFGIPYIGFGIAGIFAILYSIINYYSGDKVVLRITRAREAKKEEFPYLYNTVEGLSLAAGIPMPRVYVIDDDSPNAFATGRSPEHASVAVTTGLLKIMNRQELEGVIAHEISHIKNLDIRIMMLAAVLVGVIILLSDIILRTFIWGGSGREERRRDGGGPQLAIIAIGILLALLAPLIAQLIRLSVSRKREYLADASGAMLTRYPPGLASALSKLAANNKPLQAANKATAHLYITNPLKGRKMMFAGLFSTHPPIEDRIAKLEAM